MDNVQVAIPMMEGNTERKCLHFVFVCLYLAKIVSFAMHIISDPHIGVMYV